MKIAVEGCCHGELDKIYETLTHLERKSNIKIDLLLICGDFQSVRNFEDLQAMAVPPKFQKLNSFYKYYSGEKTAPVLTIFIGGNHEASNFLQELPYGGWVAKNIYYMGYAGIIQIGGVRIGGISGIYKGHDFNKGHFERAPYDDKSKRSVYHVRNLEVFRLKQISRQVDIFFSHDWPQGIYHHGDVGGLVKRKPFFKDEINQNSLGSKPCADLLKHLKPAYWFAAHLHVKFAAHVEHQPSDNGDIKTTKFLALDKCLPRRQFLQVLDIPHKEEEGLKIKLDQEWLTILQSTNHLLHLSSYSCYMPGPNGNERYDFTATDSELKETEELFGNNLTLPENFEHTAPPLVGNPHGQRRSAPQPLAVRINPQTTLLCAMLDLTDPSSKSTGKTPLELLEESACNSPRSENAGGSDDADDFIDEGPPSFIDSSIDQSSSTSFNNSSGFDSFNETKSLNASGMSSPNVGEKGAKELPSISSFESSFSSSSTSSSSKTGGHGCETEVKMSKRQSISDRLKAVKNLSCVNSSSASSLDSEGNSQNSSKSASSLTKSDTVECLGVEDVDELQTILLRQKSMQITASAESNSSTSDLESRTPSSKSDTSSELAMPDAKKRSSTELCVTPQQESSKSMKKMKRRNVSMYEGQQE